MESLANFGIAIIGWLAWNFIIFRIDKDAYDEAGKDFSFQGIR